MPDGQGGGLLRELIQGGVGYVWFVLLALWGGTENYISRLKMNNPPFSILELAGISGHMVGRAIFMIELFVTNKLKIKIGREEDEPRNKD